jgi:hypothetical protein
MRLIEPGDRIIHLIDKGMIAGVSLATSRADLSFMGIANTEWAGLPCYRIQLQDYAKLEPPLRREDFLDAPAFANELRDVQESDAKVFYNKDLDLNQGAYLTEAPAELVALILIRTCSGICPIAQWAPP